MDLSPQKKCIIEVLLPMGDKGKTSRELMVEVGTNNPSDIVKNLRVDNNLTIKCKLIPVTNRYGKKVYIGLYSLPENERQKAIRLLEGTAIPNSNTVNNLAKKSTDGGSITQPDTVGGVV